MESGDSNVINVILMPVLGVGVATHYKVWHRQNTSEGKTHRYVLSSWLIGHSRKPKKSVLNDRYAFLGDLPSSVVGVIYGIPIIL